MPRARRTGRAGRSPGSPRERSPHASGTTHAERTRSGRLQKAVRARVSPAVAAAWPTVCREGRASSASAVARPRIPTTEGTMDGWERIASAASGGAQRGSRPLSTQGRTASARSGSQARPEARRERSPPEPGLHAAAEIGGESERQEGRREREPPVADHPRDERVGRDARGEEDDRAEEAIHRLDRGTPEEQPPGWRRPGARTRAGRTGAPDSRPTSRGSSPRSRPPPAASDRARARAGTAAPGGRRGRGRPGRRRRRRRRSRRRGAGGAAPRAAEPSCGHRTIDPGGDRRLSARRARRSEGTLTAIAGAAAVKGVGCRVRHLLHGSSERSVRTERGSRRSVDHLAEDRLVHRHVEAVDELAALGAHESDLLQPARLAELGDLVGRRDRPARPSRATGHGCCRAARTGRRARRPRR